MCAYGRLEGVQLDYSTGQIGSAVQQSFGLELKRRARSNEDINDFLSFGVGTLFDGHVEDYLPCLDGEEDASIGVTGLGVMRRSGL